MDKVVIPVLVDGLATKKDGSVKVVLETREMNPQAMTSLFSLRNVEAWAVLAPHLQDIDEKDIPTEKPDASVGHKTESQRMRSTIYVHWVQASKPGDFESFYRVQMAKMREAYKEKYLE